MELPHALDYFALGTMQAPNGQLTDMTADFLANGYWSHDHADKPIIEQRVRDIPVGARVALKSSFVAGKRGEKVGMVRIKGLGTVTANLGDGMRVAVQWDQNVSSFELPVGYRHTISRVNKAENIQAIFYGQPLPTDNTGSGRAAIQAVMYPLNQILYGPPGTGKTYATMAWAIALLEGRTFESVEQEYEDARDELRKVIDGYRQRGQVEFVTFHQSFSYEDFVEGIKPYEREDGTIGYRTEEGIFKRLCRVARQARQAAVTGQLVSEALELATIGFDELYEDFVAELRTELLQGRPPQLRTKQQKLVELQEIDDNGTLTFLHLASAQHQHRIASKWIRQIYETYASPDDIKQVYNELRQLGGPNVSLQWTIFNALKQYEARRLASNSSADYSDAIPAQASVPRFILIIDEINRGNVASILGELISLLEEDKRTGLPNELATTLPYSKQTLTVPPNLYLLGTMNTADRSVEALDTALRRRFAFVETMPDPDLLEGLLGEPGDADYVNLPGLLRALNERLEYLLDRDHQLGHAWLLDVADLTDLRRVFRNKIIPQLQEYFHGNWGRIGQVLGRAFVQVKNSTMSLMPGFDDELSSQDRTVYHIPLDTEWPVQAFRDIYQAAAAV